MSTISDAALAVAVASGALVFGADQEENQTVFQSGETVIQTSPASGEGNGGSSSGLIAIPCQWVVYVESGPYPLNAISLSEPVCVPNSGIGLGLGYDF